MDTTTASTIFGDQENGALKSDQVSCYTFPVSICWGACLDGADVLASDWKYIPVRRLTRPRSLYRGASGRVQPNDGVGWADTSEERRRLSCSLFRKERVPRFMPRVARQM